jgi:two-component system response regulator WspF
MPTGDADPGRLRAKLGQLPKTPLPGPRYGPLLAIAASTGGPQALEKVLGDLPDELSSPVILAQHIHGEFLPGLASWLASASRKRVEVAAEGAQLLPGRVLLLRADLQPFVDGERLVRYRRLDPKNPYHPCIDTLFKSLAAVPDLRGVAALLTGMGSDGAKGLLALREAGWRTLAQDANSSVVFGMPHAAALLGAAAAVVPLEGIAQAAVRGLELLAGPLLASAGRP